MRTITRTSYAMTTRIERSIAPVATLRPWGDVCPKQAVLGGAHDPSVITGGAVATDERGFVGTPAWSPPDCR